MCGPGAFPSSIYGTGETGREHGGLLFSNHERRREVDVVNAELDYLLATRVGDREQMALLAEVERGAYRLEPFSASDVAQARDIMERYADLGLGLADASNLVLCNRHTTPNILTLDYRHFRAVSGPGGKPLRLLPTDHH